MEGVACSLRCGKEGKKKRKLPLLCQISKRVTFQYEDRVVTQIKHAVYLQQEKVTCTFGAQSSFTLNPETLGKNIFAACALCNGIIKEQSTFLFEKEVSK